MRGSLFEVVAIGIILALLPALLQGSSDSVGGDFLSIIEGLDVVLGAMFFVAAMSLLVVYVYD